MVFSGTTSTSQVSNPIEAGGDIVSYSISNKSGGVATVNVGIFYGSSIAYILYNLSLGGTDANNYVYQGGNITIPSGYSIFISSSASIDFYFTIKK